MVEMKKEWIIAGGVLILAIVVVAILLMDKKKYLGNSGQEMGKTATSYPLSAFKSGANTGEMSRPQFLGDILTLKQGDEFSFQTENVTGSVKKGYADKWVLEKFRENNERQSIHYDSWGDLAYKLDQMMTMSRYFIVNLHGTIFHVGKIKTGPVRKIKNGNEDFDF